jgi:hypothetical protein
MVMSAFLANGRCGIWLRHCSRAAFRLGGLKTFPCDKFAFSPVPPIADDGRLRESKLFVIFPPREGAADDFVPLANKACGLQRVIRLISHYVALLVREMRDKAQDVEFDLNEKIDGRR